MGFSVSASTALIFAALFLSFGIFYPAMVNSIERVNDARADQADDLLDQQNTDIEIITASSGEIQIENRGTTTLAVDKVDLFIEGEYQERETYDTDVDGDTGTSLWVPGSVLTISTTEIDQGDRVVVVTDNGISVQTEV